MAAENAVTTVTVKFTSNTLAGMNNSPAAYKAGATGMFVLQQGDVLQILSDEPSTCMTTGSDSSNGYTFGYCDLSSLDLTGTEITADHKLAVFSGHDCAFVPYNRWACDHLEEQMLPLESWGKQYVASHSQRSPITIPDIWRVVSGADGNTITFDPGSVHAPIQLSRGQWMEFTSTADFSASGTQPFALVQYLTGEDYAGYNTGGNNPGDPSMSLAVPVEQYRDSYLFQTADAYTQTFINVTAPAATVITLDGAPAPLTTFGAGKYAAARVLLKQSGAHRISGTLPFGFTIYGLAAYTSYMHPGGTQVNPIYMP